MKKQLISIAPLKAGIVLAALYGILSLIFVPFILLSAIFNHTIHFLLIIGMAIILPVFYSILGFIGGIIATAIYNLVAKFTGGLEFSVQDIPIE